MTGPVTTGVDPTETVLSESGLAHKALCDYDVVVATGCTFGCRFCNIPTSAGIRFRPDVLADHAAVEDPQREWGDYVLYREHVREELAGVVERKRSWRTTRRGCGVVGVSLQTDAYQDARVAGITRDAVAALADLAGEWLLSFREPLPGLEAAAETVVAFEAVDRADGAKDATERLALSFDPDRTPAFAAAHQRTLGEVADASGEGDR